MRARGKSGDSGQRKARSVMWCSNDHVSMSSYLSLLASLWGGVRRGAAFMNPLHVFISLLSPSYGKSYILATGFHVHVASIIYTVFVHTSQSEIPPRLTRLVIGCLLSHYT